MTDSLKKRMLDIFLQFNRIRRWKSVLDTDQVSFSLLPEQFGSCKVGSGTYATSEINVNNVNAKTEISIGKYCSIGSNLKIIDTGSHDPSAISSSDMYYVFAESFPKDKLKTLGILEIGNDVWIGDDVTIFAGSVIGNGSVVGTKSLVKGKYPPFGIYAGTPARLLRPRFSEEVKRRLSDLSWWDMPHEFLRQHKELLMRTDIDKSIPELEKLVKGYRDSHA
jgi:acetyltransferase-like isoleucine patch superfamily enzyme